MQNRRTEQVLGLVLGPAMQSWVVLPCLPPSQHPGPRGHYLRRRSAARRLGPAKQRGKAVGEVEWQGKGGGSWGRGCSNVPCLPRGDGYSECQGQGSQRAPESICSVTDLLS